MWTKSKKKTGPSLVFSIHDGNIRFHQSAGNGIPGDAVAFMSINVPDSNCLFSEEEIKEIVRRIIRRHPDNLVVPCKFIRWAKGNGIGLAAAKEYFLKIKSELDDDDRTPFGPY